MSVVISEFIATVVSSLSQDCDLCVNVEAPSWKHRRETSRSQAACGRLHQHSSAFSLAGPDSWLASHDTLTAPEELPVHTFAAATAGFIYFIFFLRNLFLETGV